MNDDERLDDLQFAGLKILQKTAGFRFGMDAVLLSDFVRAEAQATVADFGTGTGILPLLMWGRGKGQRFEAFEIQREMADMARRSVALNGLSARIRVHEASVEEAPSLLPSGSVDVIVCNPALRICLGDPAQSRPVQGFGPAPGPTGTQTMVHSRIPAAAGQGAHGADLSRAHDAFPDERPFPCRIDSQAVSADLPAGG